MHTRRKAVHITIREMPGAEVWYRVEHGRGWFKVPFHCAVQDLFEGAWSGWVANKLGRKAAPFSYVSVPLDDYRLLQYIKAHHPRVE